MIAEELAFFDTRAKLQLSRGHSRTCPVRLLFTYASTPGVHLATVAVDKEYGGSSVGQVASLRRFGLFAFLVAVVAHRLSRSFLSRWAGGRLYVGVVLAETAVRTYGQ